MWIRAIFSGELLLNWHSMEAIKYWIGGYNIHSTDMEVGT
jgi:hypothetical protein